MHCLLLALIWELSKDPVSMPALEQHQCPRQPQSQICLVQQKMRNEVETLPLRFSSDKTQLLSSGKVVHVWDTQKCWAALSHIVKYYNDLLHEKPFDCILRASLYRFIRRETILTKIINKIIKQKIGTSLDILGAIKVSSMGMYCSNCESTKILLNVRKVTDHSSTVFQTAT